MLNKNIIPTEQEMFNYCNQQKDKIIDFNDYLLSLLLNKEVTFPYGNNYGWCFSFHKKKKLICNVFPEKDAFTVMIRLNNITFTKLSNVVSEYTREFFDNKYLCGDGGWIHYRVLKEKDLTDIKEIIKEKINE